MPHAIPQTQSVFYPHPIYCSWLSHARSSVFIDHHRGKEGRFVTVLWTRDFLARPTLPGNRGQFTKKKRKANIFKRCTCQQVNMARNTLTSIVVAVNSICKKRQNCLIQGELTEAIKLCVSSQKAELFKLSTFSFQSLMLKFTKQLKLWFAMFENTVVMHLLFTATCSRKNSPFNQTNRFFMVSFLILLRSLRVHILKQLFTSGSVNIVE